MMNHTTVNKNRYRRWLALTLATLLSTYISAQRADWQKLSPWVQQAVIQEHSSKTRQAMGLQQERYITAFIQFKGNETDKVLKDYGCRKFAQIDDIAIATIPLHRLGDLSKHSSVMRIEASQRAQTVMDTVPRIVNTLPIYTPTPSHQAFTGEGVVLGIMDVGFDLTHPNFFDKTLSKYRIEAFWDQLSKDTIGSPLPVGRDFVGYKNVLAQGCATDGRTQRHGTHTTGIAAGSGYDSPYRGIAFESDICLVANAISADSIYIDQKDYYKFTSATDALGFKYLFDYAEQQGKPCVASFSEGYPPYLDEEDRLFSDFLDKLTGPGRILVASAGNESIYLTYVEKPLGMEAAGSFINIYRKQAGYRIAANGPLTISLYGYNCNDNQLQQVLQFKSDGEWVEDMQKDSLYIGTEGCAVVIKRSPSELSDKDIYLVELSADRKLNELGYIALVVEGLECQAEIFGSSSNPLNNRTATDPRWNAATTGHNIFAPGCFATPICVGSTSYRQRYTTVKGEEKVNTTDEKGKLSYFSSTGPAMNGLMKPDVVAPGLNVISSLSSYYLEENPTDVGAHVAHFEHNGRTYVWGAYSGTSMSCPVVAGTIALWLQAKPTLTRNEIISVLNRTCQHPDKTLTYPNNQYGYGEIDGYRGLLDILGVSNIQGLSHHQPKDAQVFAADGMLHVQFSTIPSAPVKICIYSTSGILQYETELMPGTPEILLSLPHMATGIYAVQLTGKEERLCGSQLIRL